MVRFTICDANGSVDLVASAMGSCLGMAHFVEVGAHGNSVLAVVEHATGFGFGGGSGDDLKDCAVCVNGAIVGRRRVSSKGLPVGVGGMVAQKEVTVMRLQALGSDR